MTKPALTKIRKILTILLIPVFCVIVFISGRMVAMPEKVRASDDLEEQLRKLEEELAKIREQKNDLNSKISQEKNVQGSLTSQINSLSNSIASLELDIAEKETEIEANETQIKILEEDITETQAEIDETQATVIKLETIADDIIKTIYIDSKTNSALDMLFLSNESTSFFSQVQYHTAIGDKEENTLAELETKKADLQDKKDQSEADRLEIEKINEQIIFDRDELEKNKEQLSAQRSQKSTLLQNSQIAAAYYGEQYNNLTDDEKKKEAEIDYVLQQISANRPNKPKGYAVQGQIIATEGSNGCSTGPHTHFALAVNPGPTLDLGDWVDPCSRLPYQQFNWGVCQGSGQIRYPYNSPFYSSRGYSPSHRALDLYAGPDKYVRAAHNGYYFESAGACTPQNCYYGCHGPVTTCITLCEDINCQTGLVTAYCHVNFL